VNLDYWYQMPPAICVDCDLLVVHTSHTNYILLH